MPTAASPRTTRLPTQAAKQTFPLTAHQQLATALACQKVGQALGWMAQDARVPLMSASACQTSLANCLPAALRGSAHSPRATKCASAQLMIPSIMPCTPGLRWHRAVGHVLICAHAAGLDVHGRAHAFRPRKCDVPSSGCVHKQPDGPQRHRPGPACFQGTHSNNYVCHCAPHCCTSAHCVFSATRSLYLYTWYLHMAWRM